MRRWLQSESAHVIASARSTYARAIAQHSEILAEQRMSMIAMRLAPVPGTLSSGMVARLSILSDRHWTQMRGIDARPIAAQVIDFVTGADRPNVEKVSSPVSGHSALRVPSEYAVAIPTPIADPCPALWATCYQPIEPKQACHIADSHAMTIAHMGHFYER